MERLRVSQAFCLQKRRATYQQKYCWILEKNKAKKEFRPVFKGAGIDSDVFLGEANLEVLATLKSKEELIGELIGLLQSPAKNLLSALQSGQNNLTGVLKTLAERDGN